MSLELPTNFRQNLIKVINTTLETEHTEVKFRFNAKC